jgi:hypothetical protein
MFADLPFAISTPLADPNNAFVESPDDADYAAFHAKLFEVEVTGWKTRYRRLDYTAAAKYDIGLKLNDGAEIALDPGNPNWTSGGLKNAPVTRIASASSGAFLRFDTGDTANFKITESFDYAADEAELTLAKKIDVFLIPALALQEATSNSLTVQRGIYLNYAPFPRRRLLTRDFFKRTWTNPASSNENIAEINDWIDYFKIAPSSRAFTDDLTNPLAPLTEIDPNDFPAVTLASEFSGVGLFLDGTPLAEGLLVAVLQSGGRTFFVWTKNSSAGIYSKLFIYTKPSP